MFLVVLYVCILVSLAFHHLKINGRSNKGPATMTSLELAKHVSTMSIRSEPLNGGGDTGSIYASIVGLHTV
jgi:hypothetical protein